jgi:uncharacterized protein YndB with AHSA1/START domain
MATIYHQVAINAPAKKVYAAISTAEGIGTWWAEQTPVKRAEGLVLEHNPGPKHRVVRLQVLDLVPERRVEWKCISTHPAESPASVWTGTHFIFELSEGESAASIAERESGDACRSRSSDHPITTLDFRQTGYDDTSRFAGFNNFAWGQVLSNLKRVVESQG